MIEYDVARARKAVQLLVYVSHFDDYVKTLKKHVAKPRAMPYKGDKEALNELLKIGRQDLGALERLIEVAAFKRDDKATKAVEYQRQFMAQKRQRDQKAIHFEEMMKGKKLSLEERRQLLIKQYEVWNKERDQFLSTQGDVSWKERNALIRDYWKMKEDEMNELIKEAEKAQATHQLHKNKRTVEVRPPRVTTMGNAMKKALDKRK